MNARLELLALRKESLLMRSALCRLQLRLGSHDTRYHPESGLVRVARAVVLAGRIVRLARAARTYFLPERGIET